MILRPDSLKYLDITTLWAIFKFQNAPIGVWSVRVIQQRDTMILTNGFTLEPTQPFSTTVQIVGPNRILPNRPFNYRIAVTNNSNVTGREIPVLIVGDTKIFLSITSQTDSSYPITAFLRDTLNPLKGIYTIPNMAATDSIQFGSVMIRELLPYTTEYIDLQTQSSNTGTFKMDVAVGKPLILSPCNVSLGNPCLTAVGKLVVKGAGLLNPIVGCVDGVRDFICQDAQKWFVEKENKWLLLSGLAGATSDCLGVGGKVLKSVMKGDFKMMQSVTKFQKPNLLDWRDWIGLPSDVNSIGEAIQGVDTSCGINAVAPLINFTMSVVNSADPNLKEGPKGINLLNCVSGNHLMPYRIYFENAGSATAPASEVYVYDTLDLTKFNLTHFRFTEFGFGNQVY